MKNEELQAILEAHNRWINGEPNGKCANLSGANLYGANLRSADLSGADLYGADLRSADLRSANLYGADLYGANLRSANLSGANLSGANLYGADLRSADLYGADLYGADLRSADLYGADLYGADLRSANLSSKEILRKGIIVKRKMTGWKKCQNGVIVKLEIPKDAIVFSINGSKCRTNIAKVVDVIGGNGKEAVSKRDYNFVYKKGKTIRIDDFDLMYNVECSTGIHFFRTRKEAEAY